MALRFEPAAGEAPVRVAVLASRHEGVPRRQHRVFRWPDAGGASVPRLRMDRGNRRAGRVFAPPG